MQEPLPEAPDGLDMMLDPAVVEKAANLSGPTIWREQRAGRFPPYESISARRKGLRKSRLQEWLNGRRDWRASEVDAWEPGA